MQRHKVLDLIDAADDAINREDFDKLMDFYSDDATLVIMPGKNATGKEAIRKAFVAIAAHFNHTLAVSQGKMEIVEGEGTALVIANTTVKANQNTDAPYSVIRKATYVFKKNESGNWLCVIDNSYGTDLLNLT